MEKQVLKQPVDKRSDSAAGGDSPAGKRGKVINWLDRLVERRIEKVERDIERVVKIGDSSEKH